MIRTCIRDNLDTLRQGLALLERITEEDYRAPVAACFNAAAGGHVRHVIEHYESLLGGLASGRIDYENRPRDPDIERDPATAAQRVRGLIERLETLADAPPDGPLRVRSETAPLHSAHPWADSSLLRELEFLLSHTVHHYALIAIQCRLRGMTLDPDFGMAPSTLRHRQRHAVPCAR
jgi:hypothetical protein